jgi:hypothetical protein
MDKYAQLREIIDTTDKQPTIVDPASNFVVVTYWWGRGNLNNNTARPCISFYEDFINRITKAVMDLLIASDNKGPTALAEAKSELEYLVTTKKWFGKVISRKSNEYMNQIYEYVGLRSTDSNKLQQTLERLKELNKIPKELEFKEEPNVFFYMLFIAREFVKLNKIKIIELFENYKRGKELKSKFLLNNIAPLENENKETDFNKEIKDINEANQKIKNDIKISWTKTKNTYVQNPKDIDRQNAIVVNPGNPPQKSLSDALNAIYIDQSIQNKTINELLVENLRYLNPLNFETMIEKWEAACRQNGCNFLSIEYPEFAEPGGYQMAINAKPLFIEKALRLCGGKNVLYIDGDMYIRKKPTIFELTDVDFMARGWWMDPRSSYKMDESITYDPYTFETSGGTMFFSRSFESNMLLHTWIQESAKPYQQGKADDRILSLIFNTNKFLCNMKIIQLPIEYLWLSLDYDERMMDIVYDYNKPAMTETIFIEHPECLTSEDTAGGAGASSDRSPKFYNFIEDNIDPVSEELYEFIMFPDKEMTYAFKNYFEYMNSITYLNDGNPILISKGLIHPLDSLMNEPPLYITNYDDRFGKRTNNVEMVTRKVNGMNIRDLNFTLLNENRAIIKEGNVSEEIKNCDIVEIKDLAQFVKEEDVNKRDFFKIIALIIRLLNMGKKVIYNPINEPGYDPSYYDKLKGRMNVYSRLEMVFVPEYTGYGFNGQFRPKIKLNQPIFFNIGNHKLIQFLSMFSSLNDFSDFINYGSYQFMSSVRVGYITKPREARGAQAKAKGPNKGGGPFNTDQFEEEYDNGLDLMYSSSTVPDDVKTAGQRKKSKKTKKLKKYHKGKKSKKN